tara:strand:- start:197 stop:520 length:324 start_codon:yes stop_codon:yes gene_type:complete
MEKIYKFNILTWQRVVCMLYIEKELTNRQIQFKTSSDSLNIFKVMKKMRELNMVRRYKKNNNDLVYYNTLTKEGIKLAESKFFIMVNKIKEINNAKQTKDEKLQTMW